MTLLADAAEYARAEGAGHRTSRIALFANNARQFSPGGIIQICGVCQSGSRRKRSRRRFGNAVVAFVSVHARLQACTQHSRHDRMPKHWSAMTLLADAAEYTREEGEASNVESLAICARHSSWGGIVQKCGAWGSGLSGSRRKRSWRRFENAVMAFVPVICLSQSTHPNTA